MCSIKDEFVGKKRNFNVMEMHGTTIENNTVRLFFYFSNQDILDSPNYGVLI